MVPVCLSDPVIGVLPRGLRRESFEDRPAHCCPRLGDGVCMQCNKWNREGLPAREERLGIPLSNAPTHHMSHNYVTAKTV